MKPEVNTRTYESPLRREQARATRRAVLEAARELFIERGYVSTTIRGIAAQAGVSPETIYVTFKNKRGLLSLLLDEAITGDDQPVPLLERDWVRQMAEERSPERRARMLAHQGRLILDRRAPIDEVLRGAAAADPKIAALWEQSKAQRYQGQRALLAIVAGDKGRRRGLSLDQAADALFAIGSPETYRALVVDRGWSPEAFEEWYGTAIERLLIS